MLKQPKFWLYWLAIICSSVGYLLIGYVIKRPETIQLLTTYGIIFIAYILLLYQKEHLSIKQIIAIGIFFRLLFLLATPLLSDDFYRFIWDGRLWFNGINPFAELPTFYIKHPTQAPPGINLELFNLINSPTHYTVYPPIPQFINWVAAWLATDSIWLSTIILRITQIAAEIGTLLLLPKLLTSFKVDVKNIAWYVLNPLIIIELVGNLHHEALMIFFLMLFLTNVRKGKINKAAFAFAMAVAAKLIPLIFLPAVLLGFNLKDNSRFVTVFSISLLVVFAPLLEPSFFRGIENSLLLYYQKFEFNSGIYYAFRQIGYWANGYNMIELIGKLLAFTTTFSILGISVYAYYQKKKLPETMLWISMVFALFSLILHPWYISLAILFGTFTHYKFAIVWSLLIMGTYAGYSIIGFKEVMPWVAFEFIAVLAIMLFEIRKYSAYAKLNAK